jgi:hypothetical protein
MQFSASSSPWRFLAFVGTLVFGLARVAIAADPIPLEIHEWSMWIVDPTLSQTNAKDQYPNTLPVFVDSMRSRLTGRTENRPSPLGMLTFYGPPASGVEVELQLAASSRFYAHWPPAETKTKRARWLELNFTAAPDAEGRVAPADEGHFFAPARALDEALYLRHGARTERFLCYDIETSWAPQVKLTGGPDRYQVENLDKNAIDDLFVIAPAGEGRRIGRLKHLEANKSASDAKKPADADQQPKKPGDDEAAGAVGIQAAQLGGGAVLAIAAAPAAAAPGAQPTAGDAKPAAAEEKKPDPAAQQPKQWSAEIAMSEPLAPDSEAFAAETRVALRAALTEAGLKPGEAELILSIYADQIFKAKELVVLFRLPGAAIEEQFPLVTYPDAKRIVRVPLVLMRNVDPQLQGSLKDLLAKLSDASFPEREKAEKRLQESGRLAVPLLKEALKDADPEIVFRAERLLLAQNESIDASAAVLPVPKEEKKEEKKDEKKADGAKDANNVQLNGTVIIAPK